MTKREAMNLFGGRQLDLAEAVGVTRSAIAQWPDELRQDQVDRVIGAAVRLGLYRCEARLGERAA